MPVINLGPKSVVCEMLIANLQDLAVRDADYKLRTREHCVVFAGYKLRTNEQCVQYANY